LIGYCHWNIPKCVFDISLDNDGVPAGRNDVVDDLIEGDIRQGSEFARDESVNRGIVWKG
jgi:hypothetical protein